MYFRPPLRTIEDPALWRKSDFPVEWKRGICRARSARICRAPYMDTISHAQRSELMSRIRSKDTAPELVVRRILHRLGYRFRLHRKDLPGRPDIVLPRHKKVVLVHGCFWHGHSCRLASKPKSNSGYWSEKIARNKERDERNLAALKGAGWSVLVLWECDIRKLEGLEEQLRRFMGSQ